MRMSRRSANGRLTLAFSSSLQVYPKLPARPNCKEAGFWFRKSRFEPQEESQIRPGRAW